jgi:hypothetical protein
MKRSKVFQDTLDEGGSYIAGYLFDLLRAGVLFLQISTEVLEYLIVAAFGHLQRLVSFHIDKEAYVIMPAATISSTPIRITQEYPA